MGKELDFNFIYTVVVPLYFKVSLLHILHVLNIIITMNYV